ncbi:hypothetical protein B0T17DRAFT_219005 [Bombardia bombarda]|uniref:Uncharacterized protein n=1 Tax=Bombardia bombarda TaxID=252184 RepID=A0AA39XAV9_9PEZI|nr:hypothetical protein B0T17DRAFT_219005 [Bombardia bombarda]
MTTKRLSILGKVGALTAARRASTPPPPPAYNAFNDDDVVADGRMPSDFPPVTAEEADNVNLAAAFEKLNLTTIPSNPTVDTCLAHLKLLFAIQSMKEDVGYTDGLWGLWDARAGPLDPSIIPREKPSAEMTPQQKMQDKRLAFLSRIREKRWALFVARAVERYEVWWKSIPGQQLCEGHMEAETSQGYMNFATDMSTVLNWTEEMLPPLDVLMVWHTHMLNPRAFLEDAMLAGLKSFWTTGMPWNRVNQAIDDSDFSYDVSDECKTQWVVRTGLSWENADDSLFKSLKCFRCSTPMEIPWTTCAQPEDYVDATPSDLIGTGYGDGDLQYRCPGCDIIVRRELLSAAKFQKDVQALLGPGNRPMPGTILSPKSGLPEAIPSTVPLNRMFPRTFPNRLLKSGCNGMRTKMTSLIALGGNPDVSMRDVRLEIERTLDMNAMVREIDGLSAGIINKPYRLSPDARIAVRKMMSRYWDNFSAFALELSGAVMRQGVFVEKMFKIDWLHSPSATDTMTRLLTKYDRFFTIMQETYPHQMAVPTLDIDLAWHTHQLSPAMYYAHSVKKTGRFIDHDDKIEEDVLSVQFEWTSKEYQDRFGEVYSECTCWYCESIRSSHISSIGKVLGLSKQEKGMRYVV